MNPTELRRTLLKCCTVLALVALLSACGSSDSSTPLVTAPPVTPPVTPPATPTPVSFSAKIQPLFSTDCVTCHKIGGIAGDKLVLNSGTYTNLVNRPSNVPLTSTMKMVVPFKPYSSVLFLRINSEANPVVSLPAGLERMPLGGVGNTFLPLSASDQALIKTWITEGAKNN